MSKEELVRAYTSGAISRREFVRKMAIVGGTVAAVFGAMGIAEAGHEDKNPNNDNGNAGHPPKAPAMKKT